MKIITLFFLGMFLSCSSIHAQTWKLIGQDIDGKQVDIYSGYSVSLSSDGSVLAIGVESADKVRIFRNQNGSWTQIGQDINGERRGDNFGYSVSLSSDGSFVAVGAPDNYGEYFNSGHVRIYQNQNGTWTQIGQDIDAEGENDKLGRTVCLSSDGSVVAIGAYHNSGNGIIAGHVRIYENQKGTWAQIGQDIDGESGDCSGCSVSLSSDGSIVAIGSFFGVRIFRNHSGKWIQIGQEIKGETVKDYSCMFVSLNSDGSVIAIGDYQDDSNGNDSGNVRIYKNQNGTWIQIGQDINGESANDEFGFSVSLNSDATIVAVGAWANDQTGYNAGHVRIYQNQNGAWTQIGADIDGISAYNHSGYSVSLSSDGSVLAIGAWNTNKDSSNVGHVRIFKLKRSGTD